MQRLGVERIAVGDLTICQVHDDHAVGNMPHHREIVRDEEIGEAELLLQLLEQVDDLAWIETSSAGLPVRRRR